MPRGLGALLVLGWAVLASPTSAWAEDETASASRAARTEDAGGDTGEVQRAPAPVAGRASTLLATGEDWPAGTVGAQLDKDTTLVPYGKGALFVPALTNPLDEPPVTVLVDGQRVEEGTVGHRIILSPGTYEVRVGSGAVQQRLRYQATVEEGRTTIIPVSWAGLTVHVVDEAYGSLRTSYELIRVEDREYMGIGFGTDEQAGEPVSTWVMRPGLYKLVRLGENYRARRDFATVRLVEGRHTHFLLVLNAETGEFAGGGEVPENELFLTRNGFFGNLVLGGDASFISRSGVLGLNDGLYFSFRGFIDARLSLELFDNPMLLRLQVEEGQTKGPGLPWQKSNDRVDLDGLYIYRLLKWLGPYVRLGAETQLLPTDQILQQNDTRGTFVRTVDAVGNPVGMPLMGEQSTFRVSPSFGLTSIKEGIGLNLRVFKSLFGEMNFRTGIGARHQLTRDFYRLDEDSFVAPTAAMAGQAVFQEVDSVNQVGIESTILAIFRLTRWVLINLEADSLVPFDDFRNTVLEVEASVALKLTSYISVNYVLRYLRNPELLGLGEDSISNDVRLRFSLEVF